MSAIAEVRSYAFRAPVQHPVRTSFGTMRERPMVLVRVATDDGAFGWGEIWCNYPSCAAEHRARLLVELVAPLLLGRSPDDPAATWNELTQRTAVLAIQCGEPGPIAQTLAGVEIALWDLLARRAGAPLWRFLGGDGDEIGVYASGLNPDEPERQAERALETGFRAVKLKVGFGIERDVRNARALRALCGRDVAVMVDANQAWDVDTAIRAACALDECALAWLEEPLRADRPSSDWRAIADATAIPLAAGENITSAEAFVAAYTDGAVAVVQPDVAKWGGLGACRTIARAARAAGRRYCPHYLGGGVGLLASAHLLAAVGGDGLLEIDVNENALRTLLAGPVNEVREGRVHVGDAPGLGVVPDLAQLEPYLVEQHAAA
ncbi:MAG TPA: mandelate racemase/muconate lactonizing enzyme family protein [Candidatus Baltobacteraceae bacterium]|nr:mandelate racemase/muconate lactonizing enzyme family protein [Candidatus Baltobacteraceae bacterium]